MGPVGPDPEEVSKGPVLGPKPVSSNGKSERDVRSVAWIGIPEDLERPVEKSFVIPSRMFLDIGSKDSEGLGKSGGGEPLALAELVGMGMDFVEQVRRRVEVQAAHRDELPRRGVPE